MLIIKMTKTFKNNAGHIHQLFYEIKVFRRSILPLLLYFRIKYLYVKYPSNLYMKMFDLFSHFRFELRYLKRLDS